MKCPLCEIQMTNGICPSCFYSGRDISIYMDSSEIDSISKLDSVNLNGPEHFLYHIAYMKSKRSDHIYEKNFHIPSFKSIRQFKTDDVSDENTKILGNLPKLNAEKLVASTLNPVPETFRKVETISPNANEAKSINNDDLIPLLDVRKQREFNPLESSEDSSLFIVDNSVNSSNLTKNGSKRLKAVLKKYKGQDTLGEVTEFLVGGELVEGKSKKKVYGKKKWFGRNDTFSSKSLDLYFDPFFNEVPKEEEGNISILNLDSQTSKYVMILGGIGGTLFFLSLIHAIQSLV